MSCYDNLTGGFKKNCDRPIKSGLRSKGLIMNVDDIQEWINSGAANQFLPVLKAGKIALPIEVIGAQPFNGTNVASAADDFTRDYTKTVVFNIPESGSAAALRVEQLTKSESGFVIVVEGKDAGGDLNGNFIIFGKDEPLLCTVAKDYVAGVSAPVITATSRERGYENFLFHTDLSTTKTTFDALYAGDLTKRVYFIENIIDDTTGSVSVKINRVYGSEELAGHGYKLLTSAVNESVLSAAASIKTPTEDEMNGISNINMGVGDDPDIYFISSVLFLDGNESAFPLRFTAISCSNMNSVS